MPVSPSSFLVIWIAGTLWPLLWPNPWWGWIVIAAASLLTARLPGATHRLGLAGGVALTAVSFSTLQALDWWHGQLPRDCWRVEHSAQIQVTGFPVTEQREDGSWQQRFPGAWLNGTAPDCGVSGTVTFTYYEAEPRLVLGDRISGGVSLRPPTTQYSVGVLPDQARNAARNLRARGVLKSVETRQPARVGLDVWRQQLRERIESAVRDERTAAILKALVVGDASSIGRDGWQQFRMLGIAHVLVISGLHIGLVAGFVWGVAGGLRRVMNLPGDSGGESIRILLTLLVALVYALLAGWTIPTQRSLVMLAVLLGVRGLGWRTAPLRALLLAVAIIVTVEPHAVLGSSLWMSAGATAVLLLLAERLPADQLWAFQLLRLQVLLVICLLPLSSFWFGEASLLSVITNLTLVPVLTFWTVPVSLLGALLSSGAAGVAGDLWRAAAWPLPLLLTVMDRLLPIAEGWGVLRFQAGLLSAVGLVGLLVAGLSRQWRWFPVAGLLLLLEYCSTVTGTQLAVLDVGQGTAVVFTHAGRTLLYDTGGGVPGVFLQAEKVIEPWLQRAGVTVIDTLMVSHRDLDHSAGLEYVRAHHDIGQHWGFGGEPCRPGMSWAWGPDVHFTVLAGDGHGEAQSNASSCVLLIDAHGTRVLLTGDIPLFRERELVTFWRGTLRADVLVVAHHGSQTSTGYTWLKWVDPAVAVLSRARANRFGHPADVVSTRLRARGIDVVDTADSGTLVWSLAPGGERRFRPQRHGWTPYWLQLR